MEPGHRSGIHTVVRSRSHYDVRSLSDSSDEVSKLAQVVAAVRVRQDDDLAAGDLKTSPDRQAIPALGF